MLEKYLVVYTTETLYAINATDHRLAEYNMPSTVKYAEEKKVGLGHEPLAGEARKGAELLLSNELLGGLGVADNLSDGTDGLAKPSRTQQAVARKCASRV